MRFSSPYFEGLFCGEPSADARAARIMSTKFECRTYLTIAGVYNESCTKELADFVVIELDLNLRLADEKHECGCLAGR
jgi:hypothetical protein